MKRANKKAVTFAIVGALSMIFSTGVSAATLSYSGEVPDSGYAYWKGVTKSTALSNYATNDVNKIGANDGNNTLISVVEAADSYGNPLKGTYISKGTNVTYSHSYSSSGEKTMDYIADKRNKVLGKKVRLKVTSYNIVDVYTSGTFYPY